MQLKTLGLAVIAALTLGGTASAQSVTIERHDIMGGDRMMRSERMERTNRIEVREPRATGAVVRGKSAMAPGQMKKRMNVQTGRQAMEMSGRKPLRGGDTVVIQRNR